MARAPNAKVMEAKRLFLKGTRLVDIAARLDVPAGTVRRWKSAYGWASERSEGKTNVRNEPPPEVASVIKNPHLTDKQRLFCLYYARSFNATRSYQRAYESSYAVANAEGSALLVNPNVRAEITRLKQLRYGKALLEPGDIFQKYMDIAFADITDYVDFGQEEVPVMAAYGPVTIEDPSTGEKVPLTQTVNTVRAHASEEVDGSLLSEVSQGKSGFKLKLADRMKALEWLAGHMDLATEEQRARIDRLRAGTAKLRGDDPEHDTEDDGFLAALRGEAKIVWQE